MKEFQLTGDLLHAAPLPAFETQVTHVHIDGDISLDVAVADARNQPDDPTILFFLPWSEYVDRPDASDRYRLLASAMSARVVALDNLGMGPNSSKLPTSMRHDIEHGNFKGNVQAQLEALHNLSIPLANVSLIGYSLGASMAARFASELDGKGSIDSITLGEPVGMTRQHTGQLMRKFAVEMINWGKTYQDVRGIHPEWMQRPGLDMATVLGIAKRPLEYMAYPRGLATAPLLHDLTGAFGRTITSETPIRIANGGASVISTTAENIQLVHNLQARGARVEHDVYIGESHGVVDAPRKIIPMLVGNHPTAR